MYKRRTPCLCNNRPAHLVPSSRGKCCTCVLVRLFLLIVKPWRKKRRGPCPVTSQAPSGLFYSLPSHWVFSPSLESVWARAADHFHHEGHKVSAKHRRDVENPGLILINEVLLCECELEFWLAEGPPLPISRSRASG